jgi:hypothetical protein|tara:strand:- start:439 stop:594 length:156 start_codon:yes stop_codon:yes gene_type:complete
MSNTDGNSANLEETSPYNITNIATTKINPLKIQEIDVRPRLNFNTVIINTT